MNRWILALAMLAACPGHTRRVIVIDLASRTAELRWSLVGDDAGDLATIRQDWIDGDELEGQHPGWTVASKRLEAVGDELHGVAEVAWSRIGEVELSRAAHPGYQLRYCPPPTEVVVAANGHGRTAGGCVLWREGTQKLRIETAVRAAPSGQSLLQWFSDGAPPADGPTEASPEPGEPQR